ncbi:MAG: hypothetical protein ABIH49_00770 [archaeon]
MGLFGFGRKGNDVVDLSERYRRQQEKLAEIKNEQTKKFSEKTQTGGMFSMFDGNQGFNNSPQTEAENIPDSIEERRRKLAKRLSDMTNKLEELSTQIYHLQQRIEVIEQRMRVNDFKN